MDMAGFILLLIRYSAMVVVFFVLTSGLHAFNPVEHCFDLAGTRRAGHAFGRKIKRERAVHGGARKYHVG